MVSGSDGPVVQAARGVDLTAGRAVEAVPIDCLRPADSPRLGGVLEHHVRELARHGAPFPPILIQSTTMRVIDGMHRLHAARLKGSTLIRAQLFECDDDCAFVLATAANLSHGLPLTRADRAAAAVRIARTYPQWSDRAVARAAGVSDKTVAALRRRADSEIPRLDARVGEDGRVRPVDAARGRLAVVRLLSSRPDASLRQIARAAGVSPTTVRDVRDRLRRGEPPVTGRQASSGAAREIRTADPERKQARADCPPSAAADPREVLDRLKQDPSIRHSEVCRALVGRLDKDLGRHPDNARLVAVVPAHCLPAVGFLARQCAAFWTGIAEKAERRLRDLVNDASAR